MEVLSLREIVKYRKGRKDSQGGLVLTRMMLLMVEVCSLKFGSRGGQNENIESTNTGWMIMIVIWVMKV